MSVSSINEKELLDLLKSDDRGAFNLIYRKYWQELYNAAYKRTKDRELCRDILQSIFADLWKRRQALRIDNLPAYLHTAVKFQVYTYANKRSEQVTFLDHFDELISSPVAAMIL